MHRATAGQEFNGADKARADVSYRDHEVAEHVGPVRPQRVLRKRQDEIGLAQLPAGREAWRGWKIPGVPLQQAALGPSLNDRDVGICQTALAAQLDASA